MTVPEGIPECLTRGECARALNLKEETVKRAMNTGALTSWRMIEGRGWRYVKPSDLADFADRCGLTVDWETLL